MFPSPGPSPTASPELSDTGRSTALPSRVVRLSLEYLCFGSGPRLSTPLESLGFVLSFCSTGVGDHRFLLCERKTHTSLFHTGFLWIVFSQALAPATFCASQRRNTHTHARSHTRARAHAYARLCEAPAKTTSKRPKFHEQMLELPGPTNKNFALRHGFGGWHVELPPQTNLIAPVEHLNGFRLEGKA